MKYDIRINNIFYREIEGNGIEQALNSAGMDVDFTETGTHCGYIHYERLDIREILESDTDRDIDELLDEVENADRVEMTYGPAE